SALAERERQLRGEVQAAVHHREEQRRLVVVLVVGHDVVGHFLDRVLKRVTVVDQFRIAQRIFQPRRHAIPLPGDVSAPCASWYRGSAISASQPSPPRPLRPASAMGLSGRPATAASDSGTSSGWHTSTTSQPASRCASTRALMPPTPCAAAMPMSSENTTPRKPICVRRMSLIQRGEYPAGSGATCGYSTWASITASAPASIPAAKGTRSSAWITSSGRSSIACSK